MKKLLVLSGVIGIISNLCMIGTPVLGSLTAVYLSLFFLGIMFSLGYTAVSGYYYSHVSMKYIGIAGGIIETTSEFSALIAISCVQVFFAAGVFLSTGGTVSARDIMWEAIPGVQAIYVFTFLLSVGILIMSVVLFRHPEQS